MTHLTFLWLAPIFFTADEFRDKARKGNPLVKQILEQGKIVTGKSLRGLLHA